MIGLPDWLLPDVETLTEFPAERIAKQLGAIRRYAGATPDHYSVARHSILVARLLPATDPVLQMMALVHDAHECWTGDLLRPATKRIGDVLTILQNEYDQRLWSVIGIDPDPIEQFEVAVADDKACELELWLLGRTSTEILDAIPEHPKAAFELSIHSHSLFDAANWLSEYQAALRNLDAD